MLRKSSFLVLLLAVSVVALSGCAANVQAPFIMFSDSDCESPIHDPPEGESGDFELSIWVYAGDEDIYVPAGSARKWHDSGEGAGALYTISDGGGSTTSGGVTAARLDSNADREDSAFVVRAGEAEIFRLFVSFRAVATDFYRLNLEEVRYREFGEPDDRSKPLRMRLAGHMRSGVCHVCSHPRVSLVPSQTRGPDSLPEEEMP